MRKLSVAGWLVVWLIAASQTARAEVYSVVLSPVAHGFVDETFGGFGNPSTYAIFPNTNVHAQTFSGSHGSGAEWKGYAVYDLSGIPNNATILQANLLYDSGFIGNTTFRALTSNPEAESNASNAWFLVKNNTNDYYYVGDFDILEGVRQRHTVFGSILTNLQAALAGDSFAMSVNEGPTVFTTLQFEVFYTIAPVTSAYSTLSVAGPFGFWNPRSHPLHLISDYTWHGSFPISGTNLAFKFLANVDWNVANWGDGNPIVSFPHTGTAVTSGPDIVYNQPTTGRVAFTFNEQTRAYRVDASAYNSISVAGTFNGWNTSAFDLELISNQVWQGTIFLLTNNVEFKFVAEHDFNANNWGEFTTISSFPFIGNGVSFGANIKLGACYSAGNYRFTFDENTLAYTVEKLPASTYGGITVAGTFNGWDTVANPLLETAPGVWEGVATLPAGDAEFKYVVSGSYAVGDFGENNQTGFLLPLSAATEFRGGNIVLSNATAGAHTFHLNLNTCGYEVQAGGSGDSDSDGLPDGWELTNGGNLGDLSYDADWDQDGVSDGHEWRAGTNPRSNLSFLRMNDSGTPSAGQMIVRWRSESNRMYRLWSSTNLQEGFGGLIQTNIPATWPENAVTTGVDSAGLRVFRVEVE